MGEGEFLRKEFLECGNNFGFLFFWVHEGECVMVVHDYGGGASEPDAEHGAVD